MALLLPQLGPKGTDRTLKSEHPRASLADLLNRYSGMHTAQSPDQGRYVIG